MVILNIEYHPERVSLIIIPKWYHLLSSKKGIIVYHPKRVSLNIIPKGFLDYHPKMNTLFIFPNLLSLIIIPKWMLTLIINPNGNMCVACDSIIRGYHNKPSIYYYK